MPRLEGDDLHEMVRLAKHAAERAYAPYSSFRVGACIRTTLGTLVAGCNVENLSFGLSHCAERTAITRAVAEGALEAGARIQAVVIYTPTPTTTPPCGMCRQVLHEFAAADSLEVVTVCDDPSALRRYELRDLFPFPFDSTLPSQTP